MIAITGANGFLGSYLLRYFRDHDIETIGLVREGSQVPSDIDNSIRHYDLFDPLRLESALQGVSTVIHCAAMVSFDPSARELLYSINVEGTRNLINASISAKVENFIYISSVGALGRDKNISTINEKTPWNSKESSTFYGTSKYLGELEVWRGGQEGLNVQVYCPSVIVGYHEEPRSSRKLLDYVNGRNRFYLPGTINYVSIRDVAEIIFRFYTADSWNGRYILNAEAISYRDFFAEVAAAKGVKPPNKQLPIALLKAAIVADKLKSLLTKGTRQLSPELVSIAKNPVYFDNEKVKKELSYDFEKLPQTLKVIFAGD